ncbi:hypothetical protein LXL04_030790 [Taraxacum kok-saghyz]
MNQKATPRNWRDTWIWVDSELVHFARYASEAISELGVTPKGESFTVVEALAGIILLGITLTRLHLSGGRMSTAWRLRGVMSKFYVVEESNVPCSSALLLLPPPPFFWNVCVELGSLTLSLLFFGVESTVTFLVVLEKRVVKKLFHREVPLVDLVEVLSPFRTVQFVEQAAAVQAMERVARLGMPPQVPPPAGRASGSVPSPRGSGSAAGKEKLGDWGKAMDVAGVGYRASDPFSDVLGSSGPTVVSGQAPPEPDHTFDDPGVTRGGSVDRGSSCPTGTDVGSDSIPSYSHGLLGSGSVPPEMGAGEVFRPAWRLGPDSWLSQFQQGVEFSRYVFPPGTIAELESYSPGHYAELLRQAHRQEVRVLESTLAIQQAESRAREDVIKSLGLLFVLF